jgi:hypothetical protein
MAGSCHTIHKDRLFDLSWRSEREVQTSQADSDLVDTLAWSNRTVHEMDTDIQIVTGHHLFFYPARMSPLRRRFLLLLGLLNSIVRIATVNTASIVSNMGGVVNGGWPCSLMEICVVSYDNVVSWYLFTRNTR